MSHVAWERSHNGSCTALGHYVNYARANDAKMIKTNAARIAAAYMRKNNMPFLTTDNETALMQICALITWSAETPTDKNVVMRAIYRSNRGELFWGWSPEGFKVMALPENSHVLLEYRPSYEEMYRAKIRVNEATGCWEWTGLMNGTGYGSHAGTCAHRFSWSLKNGPIPKGMQIDHLCRNRACSNPDHLELVTAQENNRRSNSASARNHEKTHCPAGHPYEGDNLYVRPDGKRDCKACKQIAQDRWRERHHEHYIEYNRKRNKARAERIKEHEPTKFPQPK